MLTETDPDGQVSVFGYDQLGRETSENDYSSQAEYDNDPGDPDETLTWTYNAAGQLASESDQIFYGSGSSSTTSYTYDAFGRVEIETQATSGAPTVEFDYTYDANGNVLTETDWAAGALVETTTYSGYNGLNLPAMVVVATTAATLTIDYQYSSVGQTEQMTRYQDGELVDTTTYTYDGDGNLSEEKVVGPSGSTLEDFQYVYNGEGEIVTAITPTQGYVEYTYDAAGQLTSATYPKAPWANESYTYDAAGNRTSTTTGSTTDDTQQTAASTTTAGNELTSDGTFVYEYDADGNLIYQARISQAYSADDQTFYHYNNLGELVDVCTEDNGDTITQEVTYGYNAAGQRVSESVTVGQNTTTTNFVYDLSGNAVLSFDGNQNLTGQYVYGQAVDQLLAQEDGSGNVSWMITDRDESVRDVLQSSGGTTSVIDHIDYNSFGETITETAPSTPHLTGYAGYVNDLAIGMLETDSRVYDASIGRFISQDPSGFSGSANGNLYEYTSNSPLDDVDPSGLSQVNPLVSVINSLPSMTSPYLPSIQDSDGNGINDITGEPVGASSDDDDDIGPTLTTASGGVTMGAATGNPLADQDPNDPYGATTLGNININTGLSPDDPDYTPVAAPSAADLASILGSQTPNPLAPLTGDEFSLTDASQEVRDSLGDDLSNVPAATMTALFASGDAQLQNSNMSLQNLTQNAVIGLTANDNTQTTLTFTFTTGSLLGYPGWQLTDYSPDDSVDDVVADLAATQKANYATAMSMGSGTIAIQGGLMTAAFALPGLFAGSAFGAVAGITGLIVGAADAGAGAASMATGQDYQSPVAAGITYALQNWAGVNPSTAATLGTYANTGLGILSGMIGMGSWELNTNPYNSAMQSAMNGADAAAPGSLESLESAQAALQEEIAANAPDPAAAAQPSPAATGIGKLTGFSDAQTQMIMQADNALQSAGYDTSVLQEVVHADMPPGYRGMSLDNGAALGDEAFSSQDMLNHVLEEELIHVNQKAAGQGQVFGPGTAQELEGAADAARKFPLPAE